MIFATFDCVGEFHDTYRCPRRTAPTLDVPEAALRQSLILEELSEFTDARNADDLIEVADALGDMAYILCGTAHAYGISVHDTALRIATLPATLVVDPTDEATRILSLSAYVDALGEINASSSVSTLVTILQGAMDEVFSLAELYRIPLDEIISEIHRSNMSKLGLDGQPIFREDGKVLKGPNYSPPDLTLILGPAA